MSDELERGKLKPDGTSPPATPQDDFADAVDLDELDRALDADGAGLDDLARSGVVMTARFLNRDWRIRLVDQLDPDRPFEYHPDTQGQNDELRIRTAGGVLETAAALIGAIEWAADQEIDMAASVGLGGSRKTYGPWHVDEFLLRRVQRRAWNPNKVPLFLIQGCTAIPTLTPGVGLSPAELLDAAAAAKAVGCNEWELWANYIEVFGEVAGSEAP